jgi:hypothetical protein
MTHRWPPPCPYSDTYMYLGLGPRRLREDSSLAAILPCIARTRSPQSRRTACRIETCAACDTAECARMRMVARRGRHGGKAGAIVHGTCASAQQSWRQYRPVERNLPQQAVAEMLKMKGTTRPQRRASNPLLKSGSSFAFAPSAHAAASLCHAPPARRLSVFEPSRP